MRPDSPSIRLVLDRSLVRHESSAEPYCWPLYSTEIFDHVGMAYDECPDLNDLDASSAPRIAVVAQRRDASDDLADVRAWVENGGALITVGHPGDLTDIVGAYVDERAALVDHDHVEFADADVWTDKPDVALHAIGGVRLTPAADSVSTVATWADGAPAIIVRRVGRGVAIALGADIWQSVVRIQQGYPVASDGEPADDGTAPLDDGLLKCEDGLALSFTADRAMPPGQPDISPSFQHVMPPEGPAPMFHRPHADMWRSVLLQCVWWAAEQVAAPTAWLHYWPAGVPAVAHMSHDSDENEDDHGRAALESFAEAEVRVTWCHVFPGGYSPEIYTSIADAGHEQALHYNAMDDADIAQWGWPYLRAQHAWAQAVTGSERIVSNKTHYTRWEGYTEFYEWCERLGIEIDESRGPSKQGVIGFAFGASHVAFPMADAAQHSRFIEVLMLPLHTQDLALAAHESVRDVILDNALRQHGVAHFLFHGKHLFLRADTRKACLELAAEARRHGMQWWTAAEINRWERLRRGVDLSIVPADDGWTVTTSAAAAIDDAEILVHLAYGGPVVVADGIGEVSRVTRHGREFLALRADIPSGWRTWRLRRAP